MKKSIIIFVVAALVIITSIVLALNVKFSGSLQGYLMLAGLIILVGFALFIGWTRIRSLLRKEPAEDELSKKVMTKASSLSYYISIYLWLFIMYISDKTTMATHSLIGTGIIGMAAILFLSRLGIKIFGLRNG